MSEDEGGYLQGQHGRRLLSDIKILLSSSPNWKDVELVCRDGVTVRVPGLLLGALSPLLRKSFGEGAQDLLLPDVDSEIMGAFFGRVLDENYKGEDWAGTLEAGKLIGVEFPCFFVETEILTSSLGAKSLLCSQCSKSFTSSKVLKRHIRFFHSEKGGAWECEICGRQCRSQSELVIHTRIHTKEKPYACPQCDKKFTQKSQLNDHVHNVHKRSSNVCEICGLKLGSRVAVKRHIKIHQKPEVKELSDLEEEEDEEDDDNEENEEDKPYECSLCKKRFSQRSQVIAHKKGVHEGSKPNVCPRCGKTFAVASNMKKHMLLHDRENSINSAPKKKGKEDTMHVCEFCGRVFDTLHYLRVHVKTHSTEIPIFKCDECDDTFNTMSGLRIHRKIHNGKTQFNCPICQRSCVSRSDLEKHVRIHTGVRPHRCEKCGKRFVQRSHLNYHIKTVHGEVREIKPKTHFCHSCDKGFSTSSALNKHIKSHSQERNFKCGDCGKTFIQKAHLKTHYLQHTGERPFICVICGRTFSTSSNLKEHSKIHTGEKKFYECTLCSAQYVNASDLRIHILKHSGESPYSCPVCKKSFRSKRHLSYHVRTHTGQKPFQCRNCNKSFTTPAGLRQHFHRHGTCRLTASAGAYAIKNPNFNREDDPLGVVLNQPFAYETPTEEENVLINFTSTTLSDEGEAPLLPNVENDPNLLMAASGDEALHFPIPVVTKIE